MVHLELFDLLAAIHPDGRAEQMNVHRRTTFGVLYERFYDSLEWRWLLVNRCGATDVIILDLWQSQIIDTYPYAVCNEIPPTFDDLDQAIGYVALHLVS